MPNRPAPLHQSGHVTLDPGSSLAANVGIDQTTPLANAVQLIPGSGTPLPAVSVPGVAQDATLARLEGKHPPLVSARDPVDPRGVAVPVNVAQLPLPPHAATDTLQAVANALLAALSANSPSLVAGRQPVDGSGVVQPVSVAALPLPAAAARETGNLAAMRQYAELAFLQAQDIEFLALASRGRERVTLSTNRGSR